MDLHTFARRAEGSQQTGLLSDPLPPSRTHTPLSQAAADSVTSAAKDVALSDKLDMAAGELSGGEARKLSVAIAFMGSPDVVFLDEPCSTMDPYSRRFTWDVIRRNAKVKHKCDRRQELCLGIAFADCPLFRVRRNAR